MAFKPRPERRRIEAAFDHAQEKIAERHAQESPEFLYRYRNSETPYFVDEMIQIIKNNKMFFPGQPSLNDPADCMPSIEKGVDFPEYRKRIQPIIDNLMIFGYKASREMGKISYDHCRQAVKAIKHISLSDMKSAYEMGPDSILIDGYLTQIGVLSLTKSAQNPAMWAMYAKNARGVCLQLENVRTGAPRGTAKAVIYTPERSIFDYYGLVTLVAYSVPSFLSSFPVAQQKAFERGMEQLLFMYEKSMHWSYEEEYRIVYLHGGGCYIDISPMRLSALYIGADVDASKVGAIRALLSQGKTGAKMFRATTARRLYGMDFEVMT